MTALEAILGGLLALSLVVHGASVVRNGRQRQEFGEKEIETLLSEFRGLKLEWTDTVDRLTRWERRWNKRARDGTLPPDPVAVAAEARANSFRSSRMRQRAYQRAMEETQMPPGTD